jgi:hypothetical protein
VLDYAAWRRSRPVERRDLDDGPVADPYHHSRNLGEAVAFVLVCQGASKLNGVGTLL